MSETRVPAYSTLEVDRHQMGDRLPEVLPNTDPPEAFNTAAKENIRVKNAPHAEKTLLGMRKRLFWSLIAAVALIIIGVAIGAGVGATRNSGSKDSSHGGTDQLSDDTETYQKGISANSQLAAKNYTDKQGVDHSQLYFQDHALQIWNADQDIITNNWTFTKVIPRDSENIHVKNGTSIAASNLWRSGFGSADFRCFFVDNESFVRTFYVSRENITYPWNTWIDLDRTMQASENSSLINYMRRCDGCSGTDFTIYENQANYLMINYPFGNDDDGGVSGKLLIGTHKAIGDEHTPIAVAPLSESSPRVVMYLVSHGNLAELYGGTSQKWTESVLSSRRQYSVDSLAKLATMIQPTGTDGAFKKQVMITKADGGVKMAYMDGVDWSLEENVSGMENVLPLSPIAANQLGRVYALESGPQLVEWKRIDGQIPTFERVGVIDTTSSNS